MSEIPSQKSSGERFFNSFKKFVPPGIEHADVEHLVLFNPTERDIQTVVRAAYKRLSDEDWGRYGIKKFSSMRAMKLRSRSTQETLCILWPSFLGTHDHVGSATKAFADFEIVETHKRFYVDSENKKAFSSDALEEIVRWINE